MPFTERESAIAGLRLFHMNGDPQRVHQVVIIFESIPEDHELRLLENFHKIGSSVLLAVYPGNEEIAEQFDASMLRTILEEVSGRALLVTQGRFAPKLVENFNLLGEVDKVVLINPAFKESIATKMAAFELPVLVVTATPGNLDHDPDAVKYHDLISGSSIAYVRGVEGNPLYRKFTQSFNAIQRFLLND